MIIFLESKAEYFGLLTFDSDTLSDLIDDFPLTILLISVAKSYLEQNYEEEFDRKMENPDSKNPFMKNKQSTPRARALAIMSRLREMGLYEKGKRSDYTITDNGKEISETL